MVEVVLLGTGTPNLDPHRCGSGTAIVDGNRWVLVDCGRGVAQRVIEAGLDLDGLAAVLLTHHHSDHVADLALLATMRWSNGADDPLVVVSPDGPCRRFAEHCLDAYEDQCFHGQREPGAPTRPTIEVWGFRPGATPAAVAMPGAWEAQAALVDHHPIEAAVGYRLVTSEGAVCVSGDTAGCRAIVALADGAQVLIHEALDETRVSPELLLWNASAAAAGDTARRAAVGCLVLTHLIPTPSGVDDGQRFVDQARAGGYAGPITIARDLARLQLPAPEHPCADQPGM